MRVVALSFTKNNKCCIQYADAPGVHEDAVESELSYHFDPGYSFGEQQSECKLFGNQRV